MAPEVPASFDLSGPLQPLATVLARVTDESTSAASTPGAWRLLEPGFAPPHSSRAWLYPGLSELEQARHVAIHGTRPPAAYAAVLQQLNGCHVFGLTLVGMREAMRQRPPLLKRDQPGPRDLALVQRSRPWPPELSDDWCAIGSRDRSRTEVLRYFMSPDGRVASYLASGEFVRQWADFEGFLADELAAAEEQWARSLREHGSPLNPAPGSTAHQLARFLGPHRWQVLLVPPAAVVVTWLHELAHAAAARFFGGVVQEIRVLPGGGDWGHMVYDLPAGASPQADFWVSVAPYLVGVGVSVLGSLAVALLALPQRLRSSPFIWLAVAPALEPAYGVLGWVSGGPCDFRDAFGAPPASAWPAAAGYALLVTGGLWLVQRRALDPPLSAVPYLLLAAATAAALCGLSAIPLP